MKGRNGLAAVLLIAAAGSAVLYVQSGDRFSGVQPAIEDDSESPAEIRDYGELDYSTEQLLDQAYALKGIPFESGGKEPGTGFNSSGFVQYVFQEATGIRMPRIAAHQNDLGDNIPFDDLIPGDLVFFKNESLMSGIYMGDGEFMTVSLSGGTEILSFEKDRFWTEHFAGARRLTEEEKEALHPSTYSGHDHPAVKEAVQYLDTPYLFGGTDREGLDCSFLVQEVFRESLGVYLPRVSRDQFRVGENVALDDLQAGDVLYFSDIDSAKVETAGQVTHTGIYLGNDFMIHASRTEEMTQISYLNDYWNEAFTGARRF
ncbi:hypothetical protein CR205_05710 [Alteribacter lacisalsi]|uniref:NlpC/P60 domain-containing protein n=1 Tax=Alteribacter lacisalsi TaxID=2045244 RepID=A0A2W0HB33_9BACI|nr:C40 family peptidase [Alteribacter lacisalsi]PYZ98091.1 hypothetical protein CR205_05710 [Alteribacter lacisalsi]